MKRINIFLAVAAAVIATACGKEQVALQLNSSEVTLTPLQEHTITSPNGSNLRFSSRDRYIASVNETTGLITAHTIGQTVIDVTSDQGSAEVKVTVRPVYNTFKEPCTDFSKSKADIIAMYGTPSQTTSTGVSYSYDSSVHTMDIYLFNTDETLKSSCAVIHQDYAIEAMKFLAERYIPVGSSEGKYIFANGIDNITMGVTMSKVSGYKLYQVLYIPYDGTKSAEGTVPDELRAFSIDMESELTTE